VTNLEHTPSFGERPIWERKVVTIGFTGTYDDETAESDGIALTGKQVSASNPGCACWLRTRAFLQRA